MDHDQFYEEVYIAQDPKPEGTSGWIQWKGTEVCMDIHCTCGHHSHVDVSFFYMFRCPQCKQAFAVGQNIRLIPLTPRQVAFATHRGETFHTDPGHTDEEGVPAVPSIPVCLTPEQQATVDKGVASISARISTALKGFIGKGMP